jgi:peptide subunit release factor 1 (eRF1)
MSPRGFYQREFLHPHFTTMAYKKSEAGKREAELERTIENSITKIFKFPLKVGEAIKNLIKKDR